MLLDLLSQSNYESFNIKVAHQFGLDTAVYLNLLIEINEKATRKQALEDEKYFTIDRKYITERTTLTKAQQTACDKVLNGAGVIDYKSKSDKNTLTINTNTLITLMDAQGELVKEELTKLRQNANQLSKQEGILIGVKRNIDPNMNTELKQAYCVWLDSVNERWGYVNKPMLFSAIEKVDSFANHNLDVALELLKIASINAHKDMKYAIDNYIKSKPQKPINTVVEQKNVAVRTDVEF